MALRNGFPAVSGAANFLDIRRDIAGLVARDTTGKIRSGVFPRHFNSLLTARADMKVDVAAFEAVLDRDGAVLLAHEGSTTVSIDAAPPANARIDVIWVKQFETRAPFADATDGPQFGVLKGTAAASPVKRTDLPAGALEIGTVQIPAGATTTQSGGVIITTTVPYTAAPGTPLPVRNIAERDARTETFAPGGEVYVISERVVHTKDGSGWVRGTPVQRKLGPTVDQPAMITKVGTEKVQGGGGADLSVPISFSTPFTSQPIVMLNEIGYRAAGALNPSGLSSYRGASWNAMNVTANGFTATGRDNAGSFVVANDYYVQWIAIGPA